MPVILAPMRRDSCVWYIHTEAFLAERFPRHICGVIYRVFYTHNHPHKNNFYHASEFDSRHVFASGLIQRDLVVNEIDELLYKNFYLHKHDLFPGVLSKE